MEPNFNHLWQIMTEKEKEYSFGNVVVILIHVSMKPPVYLSIYLYIYVSTLSMYISVYICISRSIPFIHILIDPFIPSNKMSPLDFYKEEQKKDRKEVNEEALETEFNDLQMVCLKKERKTWIER